MSKRYTALFDLVCFPLSVFCTSAILQVTTVMQIIKATCYQTCSKIESHLHRCNHTFKWHIIHDTKSVEWQMDVQATAYILSCQTIAPHLLGYLAIKFNCRPSDVIDIHGYLPFIQRSKTILYFANLTSIEMNIYWLINEVATVDEINGDRKLFHKIIIHL